MRTFSGFNSSHGDVCPVCKTNANVETVLVPVPGTEHDGICEAKQVHKKCWDLIVEMKSVKDGFTVPNIAPDGRGLGDQLTPCKNFVPHPEAREHCGNCGWAKDHAVHAPKE